jgi:hypothetical protein
MTVLTPKPAGAENLRSTLRLSAILVLVAAGAFVVWVAALDHEGTPVNRSGATAISERGLETLAWALGRPIYWAGSNRAVTYELTAAPRGRIYVRYLPGGVAVGSPNAYLTVATYPLAGAFDATRQAARQPGSVTIGMGPGEVAYYRRSRPTNVYVAFQDSNYRIEVVDSSAVRARRLVADGLIRRVGRDGAIGPVGVSRDDLAKLSIELGRPVYWAGAAPGSKYELTRTPDGRVYVRYLPAGVRIGVARPYLTVATYPLKDAFATTREAAKEAGAVTIAIAGGIAFSKPARPTSVYLAFPGIDEQIEVFDPSAQRAHGLVVSGRIRPVA